jgi:hypothetical protein
MILCTRNSAGIFSGNMHLDPVRISVVLQCMDTDLTKDECFSGLHISAKERSISSCSSYACDFPLSCSTWHQHSHHQGRSFTSKIWAKVWTKPKSPQVQKFSFVLFLFCDRWIFTWEEINALILTSRRKAIVSKSRAVLELAVAFRWWWWS